jgi:hypothetical protein
MIERASGEVVRVLVLQINHEFRIMLREVD